MLKNTVRFFWNSRSIILLLLFFGMNSCGFKDLTDFNSIKFKSSPEMVMPLAYGHVEMKSVIELIQGEDSLFGTDDDGDILVTYLQEDIINFAVKDIISFEDNIAVGAFNFELGKVSLDYNFEYTISLGDLLDDLSGDIEELKDYNGKEHSFPAYTYEPENPLEIDLADVDQFESVTFESGTLTIEMTNNLPVFGVYVDAELYNKVTNEALKLLHFGYADPYFGYDIYYSDEWFEGEGFGLPGAIDTVGGSPGAATESTTLDLTNVTLSNQLGVRLSYFKTGGSGGNEPIIYFSNGLDFNMKLTNAVVKNGNFKIPHQSIVGDLQKLSDIKINEDMDLHKANLNAGFLNLTMNKSLPITGSMILSFPSIKTSSGDDLNAEFSFGAANQQVFKVDLSNTVIDFSDGDISPFNTLFYTYNVEVDSTDYYVAYGSDETFSFDIDISGLDIKSADGDFGQMEVLLDESEFNLSLDFFNNLDGNLTFLSPSMNLIIENSLSVPALLTLDLTGYNADGLSAKLDPEPFIVPYPDYPIEFIIIDTVTIDSTNSNIIEFLSLPPTEKITYAGNIKMNPNGSPSLDKLNHIETDGVIAFDLEVKVPLHFSTDGINISDTLAFDGGLLNTVNNGELIMKAVNGLPFGVHLELTFIDTLTGQHQGGAIETILLEAAEVDAEGVAIAPVTATHSVALTPENVPEYRNSNGLIFKATIASPENGEKPAKLRSTDDIYLNVGLKAAMDINNLLN